MFTLSENWGGKTSLLSAIMASCLALSGCSKGHEHHGHNHDHKAEDAQHADQPEPNAAPAKDKTGWPTYTVATGKEFRPFLMRNDNNELTGFEVELVNAIADQEGFVVDFVSVPREKRFAGLQAGEFDMIAASVTITDERKEQMTFSDPYFDSYQGVIALPDKPEIKNFNELKSYKVGVIPSSVSESLIKNIMKDNKANLQYIETPYNGVLSVSQGNLDYALSDAPVLTYYANSPEFKSFNLKIYKDEGDSPEQFGFAFAKDKNTELLNKVNQGIQVVKQNGTYQKLEQKWFGNATQ